MSPPIQKDWWLAAALTGATLPTALAQTAPAPDPRQTAVVTSSTQGSTDLGVSEAIYVDGTTGRRLTTGPGQTIHVLFSDQSAITIGPNTEVTITKYQFDGQSKTGGLALDLVKGDLRVVGGLLSKQVPTLISTPHGRVEISGGITELQTTQNGTDATFLFGQGMRVLDNSNTTVQITRPGYGVSMSGGGSTPPQQMGGMRRSPAPSSNAQSPAQSPAPAPAPTPTPRPINMQNVESVASDRLGPQVNDTGQRVAQQPSLKDVLGSKAPGNQS